MQAFLALETLIVALALPCILSWILGEMHGANRMQKLAEAGQGIRHQEHASVMMPHSISKIERLNRKHGVSQLTAPSAQVGVRESEPEQDDAEVFCEEALWRKRELEAMWAELDAQVEAEEAATRSEEIDLESALQTFAASTHSIGPKIRAFRDEVEEGYVPQLDQESETLTMPLVQTG